MCGEEGDDGFLGWRYFHLSRVSHVIKGEMGRSTDPDPIWAIARDQHVLHIYIYIYPLQDPELGLYFAYYIKSLN